MKYTVEENPYIRSIRLEPVGKNGSWRIRLRFHTLREIQKEIALEGEDISSIKGIQESILERLDFIAETLDHLHGIKTSVRKKDPIRFRALDVPEEDIASVMAALMMGDFMNYEDLYAEMEEAEMLFEEADDERRFAHLDEEIRCKVIPFRQPDPSKGKKDSSSKNSNSTKRK